LIAEASGVAQKSLLNKPTEYRLQEEEIEGPEIKIVTGAYQIGKTANSCEDAFFITERGFGVADGVSGWNDYGFSSSLFSNQLMQNC
jgi:hypothetical protein